MMKTAIALGVLVALAGCSKGPNADEKQLMAYYDAQLDQARRNAAERMNEPLPVVKPEASARAVAWARRHRDGGAVNCLNDKFWGKDKPCGENPVAYVKPTPVVYYVTGEKKPAKTVTRVKRNTCFIDGNGQCIAKPTPVRNRP